MSPTERFPYKLLLVKNQDGPLEVINEVRFRQRDLSALGIFYAELADAELAQPSLDVDSVFDFTNAMSCISAHLKSLEKEKN